MFRRAFFTRPLGQQLRQISLSECAEGAPPLQLSHKSAVGVIGLPFNKGQPKGGVEGGPGLIRKHGLTNHLTQLGFHVKDYGDMEFETVHNDNIGAGIKNPRTIGNAMHKISDMVKGVVEGDGVCVTLGGDHSIALGTVHGHCQVHPNACVIWIDAHADLNTPKTSPSGNVHGMPLSFILRELEDDVQQVKETYEEWSWLKPCLRAKDITFIGLRDVDAGEQALLKKLGIKYFSMYEIDKYGIAACVANAIKHVNPNMDRPIHLSYDVDALDPSCALSTGTPVVGGLTLREGFFIAEEIAATNLMSVMDMVEVNPKLADSIQSDMTANTAARIITSCLGARIV
ncbi:arginase, hepatic-like [Watersipora subatra]|uniref:arginase, hepatic-like n=1 Tax=Watersipora subatra TaxID=2589382 RepID=UPI00355B148C